MVKQKKTMICNVCGAAVKCSYYVDEFGMYAGLIIVVVVYSLISAIDLLLQSRMSVIQTSLHC